VGTWLLELIGAGRVGTIESSVAYLFVKGS
jgi:hypothetical protein